MGDVRNLSDHPKFKGGAEEGPPDQDSFGLTFLEDDFEFAEGPPPPPGQNFCSECKNRRDLRPWWKRLLRRPSIRDLFCTATKRTSVTNPITGRLGYLLVGSTTTANSQPEPIEQCYVLNMNGHCGKFERKFRS